MLENERRITVVTCTVGSSGLMDLLQCLNNQTRLPDEWLIKDCKPVSAKEIAKLNAHANFPVRYISNPDTGLSDGLNQAIEETHAGLIALLHNGDSYEPNFLELMSDTIEENTVRYCDVIWTRNGKDLFHRKATSEIQETLYDMPRVNHPTFVTTKNVYRKVGPFSDHLRITMDFDWFLRARENKIYFDHIPYACYKMDAAGLSHANFHKMKQEIKLVGRQHRSYTNGFLFEFYWAKRRLRLILKESYYRIFRR